ncbi:MAG: FG-GAP-like repeat-containing protein [Bacteroidota bacterium]
MIKKRVLFYFFLFSCIFLQAQEICDNGIDDDGDGFIDCYDAQCSGTAVCDSFFYNQPLVYCKYIPPVQPTFALDSLWTSSVPLDTRQTVSVGDIDGDGIPEVVCYNNATDALQILDGKTGVSELVINTPSPINIQYDGPAIADTDGDGQGEIYIITDDQYLRCYENNGIPKAGFTPALTSGNREYIQSIADFNGDGLAEIYVGHEIFNSLTGVMIATGGAAASNGANGNNGAAYPVAADVLPPAFCADCAGLELVCGNEVYSVNIGTGVMTLQTSAPASLDDGFSSIADYNKDGQLDVIVSSKGNIYVWDPRTGLQIGTTYIIPATTQGGHANLADYDGNGWPEIGVGGENIFVVLADFSSGTGLNLKWSKVIVDPSGRTTCTSFDFEGDGQKEIIYRDENVLYVWDANTGNVKASTPCGSGTRTEYPIVVDVDANGEANIVCTCAPVNGQSSGVVKAYKSKTQPWVYTRKVMNQHSYFVVNINDDLTIPKTQQNHGLVPILNAFLNQPPVTDKNGNPIFIPAADIITTIDTVLFTTCSNPTTVNVTLTLCDTGYVAAPKGMKVSFYNGNPLSGGTLITTDTTTSPIPVDGCITQTFTIPYSGPLNLFVYANDKGTGPANAPELVFIECDSLNNYDNISIASSAMFTLTSSFLSPTCNDLNNGSATVSVTGSSGPYSYSWNTSPIQTSSTAVNLTAGTYNYSVTDVNGCTASSSIIVTQPAVLTVTPNTPVPVSCFGGNNGSASVSVSGGTSGYNYTWSPGGGTGTNANNLTASTYTITVTDANSCIASATTTVTEPPVLTSGISSSTNVTCNGGNNGSATITSTGGTSTHSYSWTTSPVQTTATANGLTVGTYTCTVSDAANCSVSTSVTITEPPPVIASINGANPICEGQSITLTATGGATYLWSTTEITSTVTVTPNITTTYTVTVTNAGCTATATTQVTVQARLTPNITGLNTICNGTTTTLSTSGGGTYSWNDGSTTSSITVSPTSNTTYSVTVSNALCSGTASVQVTVNQNPVPAITGITAICNGDNTTLTANAGGTYVWNTGAATNAITVTPATGVINYSVTVTTNGCTATASAQVTVSATPAPNITGTTTICTGDSAMLISSTSGPYSWNTGDATSSIIVKPSTTSTYSVSVTQNGCTGTASQTVIVVPPVIANIQGNKICIGDNVILTGSGGNDYIWINNGATTNPITETPLVTTTYTLVTAVGTCTDTVTYIVIVDSLPIPIVTGTATISYGNSTPLTASGGGTYTWTPSDGLTCANCANPTATPTATTQYCVTIKNPEGCFDSACVTVTIDLKCGDEGELYVPNGFSPNNDGQNDVLYIRGGGVTGVYWAIFDRWGEKVFETSDQKYGWDGTYKGKQLDPAVFVYYLRVNCYSGEEIIQKGNVAIIR